MFPVPSLLVALLLAAAVPAGDATPEGATAEDTTPEDAVQSDPSDSTDAQPEDPQPKAGLPEDTLDEARYLLLGQSDSGRFEADRVQAIAQALVTIRARIPELAEITVRPPARLDRLVLGVRTQTREALEGALGGELPGRGEPLPESALPPDLHALNQELGAEEITCSMGCRMLRLTFEGPRDVLAAAERYAGLSSLRYAEPDRTIGDGSTVKLEQGEDTWTFTFRRAWGDCPSGCIHEALRTITWDPTKQCIVEDTGPQESESPAAP